MADVTQTIHVPIQIVLQKLKAIVDAKKEVEFVELCLDLEKHQRLVLVDPALIEQVKTFLGTNQLPETLQESLATSRSPSGKLSTSLGEESCF